MICWEVCKVAIGIVRCIHAGVNVLMVLTVYCHHASCQVQLTLGAFVIDWGVIGALVAGQ